jgi:hypothetical protein
MNIDRSQKNKYILLDNNLKPCYSKLYSAVLTKHEAQTKNLAFKMNRVNKKYVLEKDWK